MKIITPTEIEHIAWEGRLVPLQRAYKGTESLPRVTLAEPVPWPAEAAMESETGKKWTPPSDGRVYTLVRLACNLHPPDSPRTHYEEATLTVYLRPRHGAGTVVAHDLYPRRISVEKKGKYSFGLKPDLKFADTFEASLFEAGTEIEYHKTFPVIQGYGLGESHPYWEFSHHAAYPLLGCQSVYVVVAAPQDSGGVRLSVELTASLKTRYGLIGVGLPEDARAYVGTTIVA